MANITENLKKPFSNLKNLAIGALLGMFPIINLTVLGYALEAKDKKKTPSWRDVGTFFIKGIIASIITFIWLLIPFLVLIIGAGGAFVNIALSQGLSFFSQGFAGMFGTLLPYLKGILLILMAFFVLFLVAVYIGPMSVLEWYDSRKFSAGFSRKVFKKAFTKKYFVSWLGVMLINFILLFLNIVPWVGTGIFLFVSQVFMYSVFDKVKKEI